MDNLNYNHLYYFWIIAKEGGVTSACKKLRLTQPTLSAQLKQFEEAIGQTLFERKSRKLILNDSGKLVFDYADSIFKKGDEMLGALQDSKVKNITSIKVGAVATLPKKNLHNILKTPLSHGKINISLVSGTLENLLEQLESLQLDLVLSDRPAPSELKGFYTQLAEKTPVILVASPDYKGLRRKFPQSLEGQRVFLPSYQVNSRQHLDNFFKKHEVKPHIKGEIHDNEFLRVIAAAGHGIVAIARSAISDLLKTKELYVIGENLEAYNHHYLITTDRQEPNAVVTDLLKKFKET